MMKKNYQVLIILLLTALTAKAQIGIAITGPESLVRTGMNPHPSMDADSMVAVTLYNALERHNRDSIAWALAYYKKMSQTDSLKEKSYGSLNYILSRHLDTETETDKSHGGANRILNEDLYTFFAENDFKRLKSYLILKYELFGYKPTSIKELITERTYYDDLLMFNDPYRDAWDCTGKIMSLLPLRQGDKAVDIGCGFGYNTLRMAEIVGKDGKVYGTDTDSSYIAHITQMVSRNGVDNVVALAVGENDIGVQEKVNVVFISSLYHILYTWTREDQRKPFLESLARALEDGGYLVIVDNNNLHGGELNNCHVDPRLIEAQLYYYGFEKVSLTRLSAKRYMLIMRQTIHPKPMASDTSANTIAIKDGRAIVHIGSLDSYDITEQGIDAARYVYEFAASRKPELAWIAIQKYNDLIPSENFGGEYSALQWICEVMTADQTSQRKMLEDPLVRSFYHKLTDDSCRVLRYYLMHKYKLEPEEVLMRSDSLLERSGEVGRTHRSYLEDYILALNPNRPKWEQTNIIMENCGLKPGDTIVDIGCGSGFFTHRFSNLVGKQGKVYALEIKDEHIQTLTEFLQSQHIDNVSVIKGREDSLNIPLPVNKMFMCSLYHIMYAVNSDTERDKYLNSLLGHLNIGGELIIVDNGPVDDNTLPYHGPFITKDLIIKQLEYYGLRLEKYVQVIPQRYLLVFRREK